jgi:hypothetical protein
MTLKKIIEKYMSLQKQGFESILISQVVEDIRLCQRPKPKKPLEGTREGEA